MFGIFKRKKPEESRMVDHAAKLRSILFPNGRADTMILGLKAKEILGEKHTQLECEEIVITLRTTAAIFGRFDMEFFIERIELRLGKDIQTKDLMNLVLIAQGADSSVYNEGRGSSPDNPIILEARDGEKRALEIMKILDSMFGCYGEDYTIYKETKVDWSGNTLDSIITFPDLSGKMNKVYFL